MEFVSGNIYIRTSSPMQKGDQVESHKHHFDHTTFINAGSALIEELAEDGETVVRSVIKSAYETYNWVLIKKGTLHRITALEDHTIYHCVFSHRRPDTGEVVEEWTGWRQATT